MYSSTYGVIVVLLALLVRILVGVYPYSGYATPPMFGDYEAQRHWMEIVWILNILNFISNIFMAGVSPYFGYDTSPMFGDYEAQRHWMEITYHLPVNEWYFNTTRNNLQYWGLDYPPLTAYHSLVIAHIAKWTTDFKFLEFENSRGFESLSSKWFLRLSVILSELIVFTTGVWVLTRHLSKQHDMIRSLNHPIDSSYQISNIVNEFQPFEFDSRTWALLFVLLGPPLILIDHGHFQYNCVCLGFVAWSLYFALRNNIYLSAICFVAALCFKQMALYYAPVWFCYLLGVLLKEHKNWTRFFLHFFLLGVVVLGTFLLIFTPFLTSMESLGQVLHRLFPFARGLFEDKVANFWCVSSIFFHWKELFSISVMARHSLVITVIALIPLSWHLLKRPSHTRLLLATPLCALTYFLFSFQGEYGLRRFMMGEYGLRRSQVHEKSILMVVLPLQWLMGYSLNIDFMLGWVVLISNVSLMPLLIRDGLIAPYLILIMGYSCLLVMRGVRAPTQIANWVFMLSIFGGLTLHMFFWLSPQSERWPDLKALLVAGYAFVHYAALYAWLNWWLYALPDDLTDSEIGLEESSTGLDEANNCNTVKATIMNRKKCA